MAALTITSTVQAVVVAFTVCSAVDSNDGVCDSAAVGDWTLRKAILLANSNSGFIGTILFDINSARPHNCACSAATRISR